MTPFILTDKSRFQEIYDLRVAAWENSDRSSSINKDNYPNGWYESIDETAIHFVIENENKEIAASARISLHNNIDELPYPLAFKKFELPTQKPFAFYSRLVVSPSSRSSFFLKKLDIARIAYLKENNIAFAIGTCKEKRLKSMLDNGFEILGKTTIEYADLVEEYALILTQNKIKL